MKKLLFGGMVVLSCFAITACGGDDDECKTCDQAGSSIEACQDGDALIVTTEVSGNVTSIDTFPSTDLSVYVSTLETSGATCN